MLNFDVINVRKLIDFDVTNVRKLGNFENPVDEADLTGYEND